MRQHIVPGLIALVVSAISGAVAFTVRPAPTIVQPQTTLVSRAGSITGGAAATAPELTRAEKRQLAASWGDLDQKEVDALAAALAKIPRRPLTIFCAEDAKCGDMQLDFDNAFETAHWETRLEKPLIDDTNGVATSLPELRDAINEATSGRLNVSIIQKNAPFEVLVIGNKLTRGGAAR